MRDTDRDRISHFVVRKDSGIESIGDLKGRTLAVGAKDSPQATLIPVGFLQRHGMEPGKEFQVKRFDVMVGKLREVDRIYQGHMKTIASNQYEIEKAVLDADLVIGAVLVLESSATAKE